MNSFEIMSKHKNGNFNNDPTKVKVDWGAQSNLNYIRNLSPVKLAELLIKEKEIYEQPCSYTVFITSDGEYFYNKSQAITHESLWLRALRRN